MTIQAGDYAGSGDISGVGFAEAITPADTDLSELTSSIYIGAAGDLKVKLAGSGQIVTYVGMLAGVFYPIRASQIMADTTAGSIVANFNKFDV